MSSKVTMAFVAVIIALVFPAFADGNGNRENHSTYRSVQYCAPQLDELPGTARIYCSR